MALAPEQQNLIAAVQAEFARIERDLSPRLASAPAYASRDAKSVQIAQNVLRLCIEACVKKMIPFEASLPVELAIRIGSYALSMAEQDKMNLALAQFIAAFPAAHISRVESGISISVEWMDDSAG